MHFWALMHLQYVLLQTKISNNQGIQLFIYYISKYTFIYMYCLSNCMRLLMYEHWRRSALNSAGALQGGGGEFRGIFTPFYTINFRGLCKSGGARAPAAPPSSAPMVIKHNQITFEAILISFWSLVFQFLAEFVSAAPYSHNWTTCLLNVIPIFCKELRRTISW